MSINSFTDSRLKLELRTGLKKINFKKPTAVQAKVIPLLLAKINVVVQAETGSGKTHAYLLPVFNDIDLRQKTTQAIVTAPSRELAEQLYQVARKLKKASHLPISLIHLAGGTDRERQVARLKHHHPQLVVATPGRLRDFVTKKVISVDQVKDFIIDEADMTLDMGFLSEVESVMQRLPQKTLFGAFSATIPVKLDHFLHKNIPHLEQVVIEPKFIIPPTIKNQLINTGAQDRQLLLYRLLTMGQPYLALIFTNTRDKVDQLTSYLQEQGLKVAKIHGGLTERERKRTLREVKEGQFQYVVATDLAARGLDIQGVSLVINYEIPQELEFMIHRIGRTGRNGLTGQAITLMRPDEIKQIRALEKVGLRFQLVQFKNGQLITRKQYRPRARQRSSYRDPKLMGYIKKEKRKRKPGYKKKIKRAFHQEHRQVIRHQVRKAKRRRARERQRKR